VCLIAAAAIVVWWGATVYALSLSLGFGVAVALAFPVLAWPLAVRLRAALILRRLRRAVRDDIARSEPRDEYHSRPW
jgi:hypothetical protein